MKIELGMLEIPLHEAYDYMAVKGQSTTFEQWVLAVLANYAKNILQQRDGALLQKRINDHLSASLDNYKSLEPKDA